MYKILFLLAFFLTIVQSREDDDDDDGCPKVCREYKCNACLRRSGGQPGLSIDAWHCKYISMKECLIVSRDVKIWCGECRVDNLSR